MKKTDIYFTKFLLAVFAWFFLIQPWFAFSASAHTNKFQYKDASKSNSSFDSATYFQISKDESDTSEVDLGKEVLPFFTLFFSSFSFLNIKTITHKNYFISCVPIVSSLSLCILNKVIRI